MTTSAPYQAEIIGFLAKIGIEVEEATLDDATFLPGILIHQGRLLVDNQRLLYPGDLLHEAGHIAVTSAAERSTLGGNITENKPEKEGEEMAVLLWTYAACKAMPLPLEIVFHPVGYKDESTWLINNFENGNFAGMPLLVWMGLTTAEEFPKMTRWLRE